MIEITVEICANAKEISKNLLVRSTFEKTKNFPCSWTRIFQYPCECDQIACCFSDFFGWGGIRDNAETRALLLWSYKNPKNIIFCKILWCMGWRIKVIGLCDLLTCWPVWVPCSSLLNLLILRTGLGNPTDRYMSTYLCTGGTQI